MQRITIILALCCFTGKILAGGPCDYDTEEFWGSLFLGPVSNYSSVEHSVGFVCPMVESMQLGPLLGPPDLIMCLPLSSIPQFSLTEDEACWIRESLCHQFLKIIFRVSVNDVLYTFTRQQLLYFSYLSSLWPALWANDTESIIRWILASFFQYGFMPNYSFCYAYQSLSQGFMTEGLYILHNRLKSYQYLFEDVYKALQKPPLVE
jgi:hypothetical protein